MPQQALKTVPLHTMLDIVMETLKVLNTEADRVDLGTQTVLTFLSIAQSSDGGLPQSQLEKMTGLTGAGVSRNVARLSSGSAREAGMGLVESYEDPMNRRYKLVKLSPKGRDVVTKIHEKAGRFCAKAAAKMVGGE